MSETIDSMPLFALGQALLIRGPHSPDLMPPPDYFLWGYLKGRVYQKKP
jgi:hypothetical protein